MDNQEQPSVASNYKFFKTLAVGFTIVSFITAIGVGGYILGTKQNKTLEDRLNEQNPVIFPTNSSVSDETADWKTYSIAQFGMEFKLPPQLSSLGELQDQSQAVPSPFTGKVFCLTLPKETSLLIQNVYAGGLGVCEGNKFALGAISVDFNVGRGGTFLDLSGFDYKNGKYYLRNGSIPLPNTDVAKVNNVNDVNVLKLKCNYAPPKGQKTLPPPYCFGDESAIGGLVNTRDATFPGFAVKMSLINGLTEKDFDLILSTFQFTQ